ncbi:MAG: transglycosylase domain-containing protein [Bacteriovoracia bacterium]
MSQKPNRQSDQIKRRQLKIRELTEKIKSIVLSPYRFFILVCFVVGFIFCSVTVGMGVYAFTFYRSLPAIEKMTFSNLKTLALKRIQKKNPQAYHWVGIKNISRDYLYSIVMSEDSTFFEHDGINFEAIKNSLAYNLLNKEYKYGASTISQQVVKNLFLTEDKTILRKLSELLITEKLEKRFKKNEILEIYFNVAEFGPNLFGIGPAARHYFKKSPKNINAAEGAFIAIMLPSPKRYHYSVFENENLTHDKKKKIRRILSDMLSNEYISYKQYQNYLHYPFYQSKHHGRGLAGKH